MMVITEAAGRKCAGEAAYHVAAHHWQTVQDDVHEKTLRQFDQVTCRLRGDMKRTYRGIQTVHANTLRPRLR